MISVYHPFGFKNGLKASECTIDVAHSLVFRGEGFWIDKNSVRLKHSYRELKDISHSAFKRDKKICYICGSHISRYKFCTIDHIFPKRLNGPFILFNLACTCHTCNEDKSGLTLFDYIEKIKRNIGDYPFFTKEKEKQLLDLARFNKSEVKRFHEEVSNETALIHGKVCL